jgi:hypothetical protein
MDIKSMLHLFRSMCLWTGRKLLKNKIHKVPQKQLTSLFAGVRTTLFFDTYLSFPDWLARPGLKPSHCPGAQDPRTEG